MPTAPLNISSSPIIQQTLPKINLDCIAVSLNSIKCCAVTVINYPLDTESDFLKHY